MTKDETIKTLAAIWDRLATYQRILMIVLLATMSAVLVSAGYGFAKLVNAESSATTDLTNRMKELEDEVANLGNRFDGYSELLDKLDFRSSNLSKVTPDQTEAVLNTITAIEYKNATTEFLNGRHWNQISLIEIESFKNRFKHQKVEWEGYVRIVQKKKYPNGNYNYAVSLSTDAPANIPANTPALNAKFIPTHSGKNKSAPPDAFTINTSTDLEPSENEVIENLVVGQKVRFSIVFADTPTLHMVHFTIIKLVN